MRPCLIDYMFSSPGKRDLRHANSSVGLSCATLHSRVSNPIDLPGMAHVSKRSSPRTKEACTTGLSAPLCLQHPPRPYPAHCAIAQVFLLESLITTKLRRNTEEVCPVQGISLISSLRKHTILIYFFYLFITIAERTFQGCSVRIINLKTHKLSKYI